MTKMQRTEEHKDDWGFNVDFFPRQKFKPLWVCLYCLALGMIAVVAFVFALIVIF